MTSPKADENSIHLFYSYSRLDKKFQKQLETHLALLKRQGVIQEWHDRMIGAGQDWKGAIDQHLEEASIILLLISADFLASDYCYDVEMTRALERHEANDASVIPIILRPVDWGGAPFSKLQAIPENAKPITRWSNRDEGWKNVASYIRKACDEIKAEQRQQKLAEKEAQPQPQAREPMAPAQHTEDQANRSPRSRPAPYDVPEDFIDFEDQQRQFRMMLDEPPLKRLMFIQAPGGRGKTSLLTIFGFHCQQEGIPYCRIDSSGQPYDNPQFSLALAICDQLGLSPRHIAQAVQPFSVYRPQRDIDDPSVISQIVAGVSVTHDSLRHPHIKERLKNAFHVDLAELVEQKERVVCFFDNFERLRSEEEEWLLDTLLTPVKGGKIKGVVIVTAGRRWPKLDKWNWEKHAHIIEGLPSMNAEHVKSYAQTQNIRITDEEAKFLSEFSAGIPLHMVMMVHNVRTR